MVTDYDAIGTGTSLTWYYGGVPKRPHSVEGTVEKSTKMRRGDGGANLEVRGASMLKHVMMLYDTMILDDIW